MVIIPPMNYLRTLSMVGLYKEFKELLATHVYDDDMRESLKAKVKKYWILDSHTLGVVAAIKAAKKSTPDFYARLTEFRIKAEKLFAATGALKYGDVKPGVKQVPIEKIMSHTCQGYRITKALMEVPRTMDQLKALAEHRNYTAGRLASTLTALTQKSSRWYLPKYGWELKVVARDGRKRLYQIKPLGKSSTPQIRGYNSRTADKAKRVVS